MVQIDNTLIEELLAQAKVNPRLRQNYDLRTHSTGSGQVFHEDKSQRMMNALQPGTEVAIHRHPQSTENVFLIVGKLDEILYDEEGKEIDRIHLDPTTGNYGCVVPAGVWHTVEVLEPSVIYESKDGAYGQDGSESFESKTDFNNCLGDLKKNIEYLIGMERHSGSMEVITPVYVSRMLNVPLEEVEKCMKEMGVS